MTQELNLTETESKIWAVLRDEKLHSARELMNAWDTMAEMGALHVHIFNLRTKIKRYGYGIALLRDGQVYYQVVRRVQS